MVTIDTKLDLSTIISNIIATTIVYPLDTIRIRKQIQLPVEYKRNTLYKGYGAGILRQICYSSPNIILFRKMTHSYRQTQQNDPSIFIKTIFAAVSGAIGGIIGNPAEVLQIRSIKDPLHKNVFLTAKHIHTTYGMREYFKGIKPMALRASVFNAGRLPVYSETKKYINETIPQLQNSVYNHAISSFVGAFVGVVISNPIDVVKTRIQSNRQETIISQLVKDIMHTEGPSGFYRGFVQNFLKSGPHSIISFILIEQIGMYMGGEKMTL